MFKKVIYLSGVTILSLFLSIQIPNITKAENVNDKMGFSSNHIFEVGSFGENINILNGNLNLIIPIGPEYRVNSRLGYQLKLYYNSKVWETLYRDEYYELYGKLVGRSPYGLGFKLHFGRIYHRDNEKTGLGLEDVYRFVTPDGSIHYFDDDGDRKTVDNTFYKIEKSGDVYYVHYGNGTKLTLAHHVNDASPEDKRGWWTTRIETPEKDASGEPYNYVDIHYLDSYGGKISYIEDCFGRKIEFSYPSSYIIEITLPSFGNNENIDSSKYIMYKLSLDSETFTDPAKSNHTESAKVLKHIDFYQDGTSYKDHIDFTYGDIGDSGVLKTRTLPYDQEENKMEIRYHYGVYTLGDKDCISDCTKHTEIYKKTLTYNGQSYRWYINRFRENNTEPVPQGNVRAPTSNPSTVYVWDAYNNLTMHNFKFSNMTACVQGCAFGTACTAIWDDGLNTAITYFHGEEAREDNFIRKVEMEYVADGMNEDPNGTPEYFHYGYCQDRDTAYRMGKNIRLKRKKVTYFDDEKGANNHDVYTVEYKDWDGYGHYREAWEYRNQTLYRITKKNYNPNGPITTDSNWITRTYDYKETRKASGEAVSRSDFEFSNSGNDIGKLKKRTSRVSPGTTDNKDVVYEYQYDPVSGNLTNKQIKWLDDGSISYSIDYGYLTASINGLQRFIGSKIKTKKYTGYNWYSIDRDIDFNTGFVFKSRKASKTDHSEYIETSFDYDLLGRLTSINPTTPEKPTFINYPNIRETEVKQGTGEDYIYSKYLYDEFFRLKEIQKRNYAGSLSVKKFEYDVLGNKLKESEWAAEDATTFDYTEFNYYPDEASSYPDPFYRIRVITPPDADLDRDGTCDDLDQDGTCDIYTEFDYKGLTKITTIHGIEGIGGKIDSITKHTNDVFGRLVYVDSPVGGADATYAYDERNKLLSVEMGDQVRTFNYNPLGRLTLASNPENGTVHYESYDPMGKLLQKKDGKGNTFEYSYDAAGRLTETKLIDGQNQLTLSKYFYDAADFNPENALGRLVKAESYHISYDANYQLVSELLFAEKYNYNVLNGRLGEKIVNFSDWDEDLKTAYSYNNYGLIEELTYPKITTSNRTNTKLYFSYQNGYLVDVYDPNRHYNYVRSFYYNHASGVSGIFYHNETLTDIQPDMRYRPSRIQVKKDYWDDGDPIIPIFGCQWGNDLQYCGQRNSSGGEVTIWNSGIYKYDGAGNIYEIGADENYYYDHLNRLITAYIYRGINNSYTLQYNYDEYGNMLYRSKKFNDNDPFVQDFFMDDPVSGINANRIVSYQITGDTTVYNYEYDGNGNVTKDEKHTYMYDERNRLLEVTTHEGDSISKYYYNSNGYRIISEDENTIRYYIRDKSGKVLTEYKKSKEEYADYIWDKDYVYANGFTIALIKNSDPEPPKNLYATDPSSTGLTLHWEKSPDDDIDKLHNSEKI